MTTRTTLLALPLALLLVVSACASDTDGRDEVTHVIAQALAQGDPPSLPRDLEHVFGDAFGETVIQVYADEMKDPAQASSQPITKNKAKLPSAGEPLELPSSSSQGGGGGVAAAPPTSNAGLPGGTSSSVTAFASLLCGYASRSCVAVLGCSNEAWLCDALFSTGNCMADFERRILAYGVTSVPAAAMSKLQCLDAYCSTTAVECRTRAKFMDGARARCEGR